MSQNQLLKRTVALSLIASIGFYNISAGAAWDILEEGKKYLSGDSEKNKASSDNNAGGINSNTCAAFGAVIGVLASGGDSLKEKAIKIGGGALFGKVICTAIQVNQTKSDTEVDKAYKQKHGQLAKVPVVVSNSAYAVQNGTKANPVSRDNTFKLESYVEVANGQTEKINRVEQVLTIESPLEDSNPLQKKELAQKAGAYSTSWDLKLTEAQRQNLATGKWTIQSQVYVNGKEMQGGQSKTDSSFKLAYSDHSLTLAMVAQ